MSTVYHVICRDATGMDTVDAAWMTHDGAKRDCQTKNMLARNSGLTYVVVESEYDDHEHGSIRIG